MAAPPFKRPATGTPSALSAPLLQSHLSSYQGQATPAHSPGHSSPQSAQGSRPGSPPGGHPKGHLTVKLVQARGLAIAPSASEARPYVVVTFENNEFVSREPIESHEPSSKGVAVYTPSAPPTPSSGILGLGSLSKAFDLAARSRAAASGKTKLTLPGSSSSASLTKGAAAGDKPPTTPKASADEKKEWIGKPPPSDPVWKHEVTLWVERA